MADAAKIRRRTAKATLTRNSKALMKKLGDNRPGEEIKETFQQVKDAYKHLIIKNDEYTEHIEEEKAFQQEER